MNRIIPHIAVLLLVVPTAAGADDAAAVPGRLSLSGYYTLDLTVADGDTGLISTSGNFRRYEDGVADGRNSIAGLQLSYDFNEALSATVQGAAYFEGDGDATSDLEWAYLTYNFGENASVRTGRFQIPFMRGTELRNVGYTRLWARPLVPGAGAGGFNEYDGVELIKRFNHDGYAFSVQAAAGVPEHDLARIDGDRIVLLSGAFETDTLWMRLSAFEADFTVRQRRTGFAPREDDVAMGSFEMSLDLAPYVINAGYVDGSARLIPDDSMAYLSVGRRFGRFTPYLLAAEYEQSFGNSAGRDGSMPPMAGGGGGRPTAGPGRPAPVAGLETERRSLGLGLRWDVRENLAVKFQYEDVSGESFVVPTGTVDSEDGKAFTIQIEGVFR